MFSFFKKKPSVLPIAKLLELDDVAFVKAILPTTTSGPPGAGAMRAVAYMNFGPLLQAAKTISRRRETEKRFPKDTDSFIVFFSDSLSRLNDEHQKLRITWFLEASLIYRASEKSEANADLIDDVATIWLGIARGGAVIHGALEYNALWSVNEKEFFSQIESEEAGVQYVLSVMIPKHIRGHSLIRSFAAEYGLSYSLGFYS